MLWDLEHNSTDHIPGKLSLCIEMPIMVRHNIATELCITKAQEGTVAGWEVKPGPYGKETLDMLFSKLTDPPKSIKLEGLPVNVIPIVKISSSVKCRLINDQVHLVDCQQVPVIPNFAMTDDASQGKTTPDNIVDITNCTSHQSYYTALSRSASAVGTMIVQSFLPGLITGGASFCELEMLDEITTLVYNSKLPEQINGQIRNARIRQFQEWKGPNYVDRRVHKATAW